MLNGTLRAIDVRGLRGDERPVWLGRLREELEELGFLALRDHGVDQDLIAAVYAAVRALFALPPEVLAAYDLGGGERGYTPFGREKARDRAVGDLKAFWHVGRELPDDVRPAAIPPNVWPAELPALRATTLRLYDALEELARTILAAIAEAYGLPPETLVAPSRGGNSVLRLIEYPPLPPEVPEGAIRAAAHEDINLITLLCEGTSPGLEILTREGTWRSFAPGGGAIIVNAGDMLMRLTNGVIPSTTHRVVNPVDAPNVPRYSIPFFVHPVPSAVIEPLPRFVAPDRPARYGRITADDYLKERLRENGLRK